MKPISKAHDALRVAVQPPLASLQHIYFANVIIVGFLQQRKTVFNQNRQWNNSAYITKDGVKLR